MNSSRIKLNRLPLTALRTFEAAARLLSFKDAADELNVSATTVSNQIRKLERDWNCKLFIRKTRAVVLTDSGRSLSGVVSESFGHIKKEIESHIGQSKRSLRIGMGPIFGRWIIPKMNSFQKKFPNIDLVFEQSQRITNSEMMSCDIQIDWGESDSWFGLNSDFLMNVTYSPVISPKLFAELSDSLHDISPTELLNFNIIHQYDFSEWRAWMDLSGFHELKVETGLTIMDSNVALQAAIDSGGVALGSFPFVDPEIMAGTLIKLFDIDLQPTRAYHILKKQHTNPNPDILLFVSWLKEQVPLSHLTK